MTPRRRRGGTRRPWTVFVHDIGPTFTYATEERAHAKAQALAGAPDYYGKVTVYNALAFPPERTRYGFDMEPVAERFEPSGWVAS